MENRKLEIENEGLQRRVEILEEFALFVLNNGITKPQLEIPERDDLLEWLCDSYQHQLDAFFTEIENLQIHVSSLRNRLKHDIGKRKMEDL